MKKIKLVLIFLLGISSIMMQASDNQIDDQIYHLQKMLVASNHAYIYYTTPMYQQWLTLHWFLQYIVPFRFLEGQHSYNAEVLLSESKKIAELIVAMEKIKEFKKAA